MNHSSVSAAFYPAHNLHRGENTFKKPLKLFRGQEKISRGPEKYLEIK